MRGEYQDRKVWARGKEVFIGVDVHKESWHVTARAEEEEIFHGRIPSHYDVFQVYFVGIYIFAGLLRGRGNII